MRGFFRSLFQPGVSQNCVARLFFVCLLSGCTPAQEQKATVIELPVNPAKAATLTYSKHFQLDRLLFFDTTLIVSNIEKVARWDNYIVLLCGGMINKLLVKNLDNGTLRVLGKKGKGPGEYVTASNFTVNKPKDHIYMLDGKQGKVLVYAAETGDLVKEYGNKNLRFAQSIALAGPNVLAVYGGVGFYGNLNYRLFFLDLASGKILSSHFPLEENQSRFMFFIEADNFTDSLLFHYKFNDTLYTHANGKLAKKYHINFGKKSLPENVLQKEYADIRAFLEYCKTTPYAYGIANVLRLPDHLFFTFEYQGIWLHCFYHLASGEYLVYNQVRNDLFGIADSDLTSYTTIPRGHNGNTLIFVVEPYDEKLKIEQARDKLAPEEWARFYDEKKPWIDLFDSLRYDSNAILFLLNFKQANPS